MEVKAIVYKVFYLARRQRRIFELETAKKSFFDPTIIKALFDRRNGGPKY